MSDVDVVEVAEGTEVEYPAPEVVLVVASAVVEIALSVPDTVGSVVTLAAWVEPVSEV